jgi:hypothetical protein
MLRRIFGLKRNEIIGGWRKLHNEESNNLYSSPNLIRMVNSRGMKWPGHLAHMGERTNAYRILVRKPGRKRTR